MFGVLLAYAGSTFGVFTLEDLSMNSSGISKNLTLTSPQPPPAVFDARVSTGNDDVEESASGNVLFTSSDLELVDDTGNQGANQKIGLRFQNVSIPNGSSITSAYLEFEVDESTSIC